MSLRSIFTRGAAISLFCLLAAAPAHADKRWTEPYLAINQPDTHKHMAISFAGTLVGAEFFKYRGYPVWKANLMSAGLITAAGLVKEFGQSQRPSGNDMLSNVVGVSAALGLQFTFKF